MSQNVTESHNIDGGFHMSYVSVNVCKPSNIYLTMFYSLVKDDMVWYKTNWINKILCKSPHQLPEFVWEKLKASFVTAVIQQSVRHSRAGYLCIFYQISLLRTMNIELWTLATEPNCKHNIFCLNDFYALRVARDERGVRDVRYVRDVRDVRGVRGVRDVRSFVSSACISDITVMFSFQSWYWDNWSESDKTLLLVSLLTGNIQVARSHFISTLWLCTATVTKLKWTHWDGPNNACQARGCQKCRNISEVRKGREFVWREETTNPPLTRQ